jgi:large subunit ribosomal protein L31
MKKNKGIYQDTKFICSCGETFIAKSNKEEVHVEVCSKCHPFYTNQQSRKTHTGRVDKFNKKYGFTQEEAA